MRENDGGTALTVQFIGLGTVCKHNELVHAFYSLRLIGKMTKALVQR